MWIRSRSHVCHSDVHSGAMGGHASSVGTDGDPHFSLAGGTGRPISCDACSNEHPRWASSASAEISVEEEGAGERESATFGGSRCGPASACVYESARICSKTDSGVEWGQYSRHSLDHHQGQEQGQQPATTQVRFFSASSSDSQEAHRPIKAVNGSHTKYPPELRISPKRRRSFQAGSSNSRRPYGNPGFECRIDRHRFHFSVATFSDRERRTYRSCPGPGDLDLSNPTTFSLRQHNALWIPVRRRIEQGPGTFPRDRSGAPGGPGN